MGLLRLFLRWLFAALQKTIGYIALGTLGVAMVFEIFGPTTSLSKLIGSMVLLFIVGDIISILSSGKPIGENDPDGKSYHGTYEDYDYYDTYRDHSYGRNSYSQTTEKGEESPGLSREKSTQRVDREA